MRVALVVVGCAHQPAPPTTPATTTGNAPSAELVERGAALFDAAMHDDRQRLKGLVDWSRYRMFVAWHSSPDEASAARAIADMEAEPQPSDRFVDGEVEKLASLLKAVASGTLPPRPLPVTDNAELRALRAGPQGTMSPSRARLTTYATEALQAGRDISYEGVGRITLLFMAGQLVALFVAS